MPGLIVASASQQGLAAQTHDFGLLQKRRIEAQRQGAGKVALADQSFEQARRDFRGACAELLSPVQLGGGIREATAR